KQRRLRTSRLKIRRSNMSSPASTRRPSHELNMDEKRFEIHMDRIHGGAVRARLWGGQCFQDSLHDDGSLRLHAAVGHGLRRGRGGNTWRSEPGTDALVSRSDGIDSHVYAEALV